MWFLTHTLRRSDFGHEDTIVIANVLWNAKCDKNRFILSTGSFPDLLDTGAIYGSKYDPENA